VSGIVDLYLKYVSAFPNAIITITLLLCHPWINILQITCIRITQYLL